MKVEGDRVVLGMRMCRWELNMTVRCSEGIVGLREYESR